MAGNSDSTSLTLLLSPTGINMIYSPENMKLMNWKQKVIFGGKQLDDNTSKGKLWCTLLNVDKLESPVCLTKNCEQNFLGGGEKRKFPIR